MASRSRQITMPFDGSASPAIIRNAVDLPQPEGPSSETNSLSRISRSSPDSAVTPLPNVVATPRNDGWRGRHIRLRARSLLRPQIDTHALVHELQRVGFLVIER